MSENDEYEMVRLQDVYPGDEICSKTMGAFHEVGKVKFIERPRYQRVVLMFSEGKYGGPANEVVMRMIPVD